MKEEAAIWMFLSIAAICYTWHKIATAPPRKTIEPATEYKFLYNGKPVNGAIEITTNGVTSTFKVVDGKIA